MHKKKKKKANEPKMGLDVKEIVVAGDRATATAVYHFAKNPDDKVTTPMSFALVDDAWTVCSPGPR